MTPYGTFHYSLYEYLLYIYATTYRTQATYIMLYLNFIQNNNFAYYQSIFLLNFSCEWGVGGIFHIPTYKKKNFSSPLCKKFSTFFAFSNICNFHKHFCEHFGGTFPKRFCRFCRHLKIGCTLANLRHHCTITLTLNELFHSRLYVTY